MLVLQVVESIESGHGDLATDLLRYWSLQEFQQFVKAGRHQLHADPDVTGRDETSKTHHDLLAVVGLEHHVHVHHDPLGLLRVTRSPHLLARDNLPGFPMFHLDHVAARAIAQVPERDQLLYRRLVRHPIYAEHP